MSAHKDPKYQTLDLVESLRKHGLPTNTPSQLADAFRFGWQAATEQGKRQPQWLPIADAPFNIDLLVLRMTGSISQDYRSAQYPNTWTHWQSLPLPPTATPQGKI